MHSTTAGLQCMPSTAGLQCMPSTAGLQCKPSTTAGLQCMPAVPSCFIPSLHPSPPPLTLGQE